MRRLGVADQAPRTFPADEVMLRMRAARAVLSLRVDKTRGSTMSELDISWVYCIYVGASWSTYGRAVVSTVILVRLLPPLITVYVQEQYKWDNMSTSSIQNRSCSTLSENVQSAAGAGSAV